LGGQIGGVRYVEVAGRVSLDGPGLLVDRDDSGSLLIQLRGNTPADAAFGAGHHGVDPANQRAGEPRSSGGDGSWRSMT
jgi:hypothetical protein